MDEKDLPAALARPADDEFGEERLIETAGVESLSPSLMSSIEGPPAWYALYTRSRF